MADVAKVKRNVARMVQQGAPETDIDGYLATEGVTPEQLRASRETTLGGLYGAADAGVAKAVAGAGGALGDLTDLGAAGIEKATNFVTDTFGMERAPARDQSQSVLNNIPRSADIQKAIERDIYGGQKLYEPQNAPERYAQAGGEFAGNLIGGGRGIIQKGMQWLLPAAASETAGHAAKDTALEPAARIVGALTGTGGAMAGQAALNSRAARVPGMSGGASRTLERTATPGMEARLAELGPDAFLLEGSPAALGAGQGIATRPGTGQSQLVNAITARQRGANARLASDLDDTLGRTVAPSAIEQSLEAQRASLQPLYQAVTGLNEPVNLRPVFDRLRMAIPEEAGATQAALRRVLDMVAPAQPNGQRAVRSTPREVLNVRQALDDELVRVAEQPKATRAVTEFRRLVDEALAEAVPDIKHLDATYSNLMRESENLRGANQLLRTGPEAMRPEDLIAQRRTMPLPQREAQRHGLRAELDRLVGTKANDITALKQAFMADGDWNRVKLAEVFGGREADRILRAVDREAAFQDAYRKIVENSQTAQRLGGVKMVEAETGQGAGGSLRDTTLLGALAQTGKRAKDAIGGMISTARRASADDELARALSRKGGERDDLLQAIRKAQRKREAGRVTPQNALARALLTIQGATAN